jgi:ABC-type phosphate/phosphonate transport system substrate-binding protein
LVREWSVIVTKGIEAANTRNRLAGGFPINLRFLRLAFAALALAAGGDAMAQKADAAAGRNAKAGGSEPRLNLAINEGGAANADYSETLFRFQEFAELVEKTLNMKIAVVGARDRNRLKENLKARAYQLLLARPNDVPAEAVRDFGYQVIATAKEPSQTWFVVMHDSPLRTIADVKGRTIVTPDQYSNMWRVASAMLRDNKIDMSREQVKSMRDQAAIGWSLQSGFFDVGVLNSISGVARTWEKNGGRVIAKSRDLPNMPFIASPDVTSAQVAKLRAAVVNLDQTEPGRAILKKIGLTGFQETPNKVLLDFLAWIGDLEVKQP